MTSFRIWMQLLLLLLIFMPAIRTDQTAGELSQADEAARRPSESRCIATFLETVNRSASLRPLVKESSSAALERWEEELGPVSSRPLLIHASAGSTATRSLAKELALFGVTTLHWRQCYGPSCGECIASGALQLWSSLEALLPKITSSQLMSFFADNEAKLRCADALSDSPVARLAPALLRMFPNSLVLFTDRSAEEWVAARKDHSANLARHLNLVDFPYFGPCSEDAEGALVLAAHSDGDLALLYDAHRSLMFCSVSPDRLLVVRYFIHPKRARLSYVGSLAEFLTAHDWPLASHPTFFSFSSPPSFLLSFGVVFIVFLVCFCVNPFRIRVLRLLSSRISSSSSLPL